MNAFDRIVEERIRAAAERGELSGLPGEGKPLPDEDLVLIPEEMRLAIRVLRNAGISPPAIAELKELHSLVEILVSATGEDVRRRALGQLNTLVWRLEAVGLARAGDAAWAKYRDPVLKHLTSEDLVGAAVVSQRHQGSD